MAIPKIPDYDMQRVSILTDNKVDWQIEPPRSVLLIHDMQNYFVNFYNTEPKITLLKNIRALKSFCKGHKIPVIYSAQPKNQSDRDRALLNDFWGPGLREDAELEQIVDELKPDDDDIRFIKWRYSAFQRTPLYEYMVEKKRDQLIICGIYAHIGILATSLEAFMKDIQAFVVSDAVADFSADKQIMALEYIAQCCGKVIGIEEIKSLSDRNNSMQEKEPTVQPLTLETMKQDIASSLMLPLSEVGEADNLIHLGLDSIRLMTLVEKWRAAGASINFLDLAETVTLQEWWKMIEPSFNSGMEAVND